MGKQLETVAARPLAASAPPPELPRVSSKLDGADVKRVLDECASRAVREVSGLSENLFASNCKIGADGGGDPRSVRPSTHSAAQCWDC